jgi:hypothetical protein
MPGVLWFADQAVPSGWAGGAEALPVTPKWDDYRMVPLQTEL